MNKLRYGKWNPKGIYWRIFIVWLSLKWVLRINLGDIVIYQGNDHIVNNGVCKPQYDLIDLTLRKSIRVHKDNFTKKKTFNNYIHGFKSGYFFYMTSWFNIWYRYGIEDWMGKV